MYSERNSRVKIKIGVSWISPIRLKVKQRVYLEKEKNVIDWKGGQILEWKDSKEDHIK